MQSVAQGVWVLRRVGAASRFFGKSIVPNFVRCYGVGIVTCEYLSVEIALSSGVVYTSLVCTWPLHDSIFG